MTKVKMLILNTGYIESASLASLILYHPTGFDSVQEALEDLARIFVKSALRCRDTERSIIKYDKCKAHLASFDACYEKCSSCGGYLPYLSNLSVESLEKLFLEFFGGTMDNTHELVEELWELDDWDPFVSGPETYSDRERNDELTEAFRNRVDIESADGVVADIAYAQLTNTVHDFTNLHFSAYCPAKSVKIRKD